MSWEENSQQDVIFLRMAYECALEEGILEWGGSREGAVAPSFPYPSGFWFTKTQLDPCFLSWASNEWQ